MIKFLKVCWLGSLWLGLAIFAVFTLAGFWLAEDFRFDIVAQFRVQYFLAGVVFCILVALSKRRWLFILSAGMLSLNGCQIFVVPDLQEPIAGKQRFSILSMNLYMGNHDHTAILDFIAREDPDILFLIETVHLWRQVVEPLRKKYKYQKIRWGNIENGVALYSKYPLEVLPVSVTRTVAYVNLEGQHVLLVGCHPPSPRDQRLFEQRNRYLEALGQFVGQQPGPVLVFGDFNCSPWTPTFKKFLAESGLNVVAGNFYHEPTWPVDNPLIGVPIDHFLYKGNNIHIVSHARSESVGSDHYSIKMEFQVK